MTIDYSHCLKAAFVPNNKHLKCLHAIYLTLANTRLGHIFSKRANNDSISVSFTIHGFPLLNERAISTTLIVKSIIVACSVFQIHTLKKKLYDIELIL